MNAWAQALISQGVSARSDAAERWCSSDLPSLDTLTQLRSARADAG